jgi:hypothetical protein
MPPRVHSWDRRAPKVIGQRRHRASDLTASPCLGSAGAEGLAKAWWENPQVEDRRYQERQTSRCTGTNRGTSRNPGTKGTASNRMVAAPVR